MWRETKARADAFRETLQTQPKLAHALARACPKWFPLAPCGSSTESSATAGPAGNEGGERISENECATVISAHVEDGIPARVEDGVHARAEDGVPAGEEDGSRRTA